MNVKRISKSIPAALLLMVLMLVPFTGASCVFAQEDDFIPDLRWNYASYEEYAEAMTGMKLDKTDNKVQLYNTFVDQAKLSGETTIDTLFDSAQEGYSSEMLLTLNPVQLTEEAPVFKGEDGNYYVVSAVYEMNNGLIPKDYQPATSFYNYLAEAFTDVEYVGKGVFRIPAERYEYCFYGHYHTDGPEGNLVEIVFGLRIQSLYGYDPKAMPVKKSVLVTITDDEGKREVPAMINMETGTVEVQVLKDEKEGNLSQYSMEAVVNCGESIMSVLSVSEDGKSALFAAGDSHAIGAIDIAVSKTGTASTGLITEPVIVTPRPKLMAARLRSTSTSVVNNITYLDLPEGCVPANLAVGDKFIYRKKNVYIAGVQNANDAGDYTGKTGIWNGTSPATNLHIGSNNIPTHDAQWFCYYNNLSNWRLISDWFRQDAAGYSALNDPQKPDTNTAVENSMRQMTTENMNRRAAGNGASVNLGGTRVFGYISEKLGTQTDTTGTKTLDLNQSQLIFGCMHAWAYEGSTTPTDIGQALATFAGTSEIAYDQFCGNYFPNLALQCTSVTQDGDYINATFKCCTSILGVGGVYANNRNNYQCAFSTLYVRYPNATGSVSVKKVWDSKGYSDLQPSSVKVTLYSDAAQSGTFRTTGKTATLSAANGWKAEFIGLQTNCTGTDTRVQYYVAEDGVSGYTIAYSTDGSTWKSTASGAVVNTDGTINVKNTLETGSLMVYKVWDDEDNAYYTRLVSVTMTLWSDYEVPGVFKSTGKTVTLKSSDNWAPKSFTDLPVYCKGVSTKARYYVVETAVSGYETSYSKDGETYSVNATVTLVNTGGKLHIKNKLRDIPNTPYGTTTVSKTVTANGKTVSSDDQFLFRADIRYRPETTEGLKWTRIADYSHFAAIRYYRPDSSESTLAKFTSDSVKDGISFDNTKKVSLYFILKGGESISFRIFDKGAKVSITELSAEDPDLIAVASFLGKTGQFSDRYIASMSSKISNLQANANGSTFIWLDPINGPAKSNDSILLNLTTDYTVDADKRQFDFVNDRTYDLSVKKVVKGSLGSKSDSFNITLTLRDASGNPLNKTFRTVSAWKKSDGSALKENGTITFTNGKATIALRDGCSVMIHGIPWNVTYSVDEEDYKAKGYVVSYEKQTGNITDNVNVTVTNTRDGIVPTGINLGAAPVVGLILNSILLLGGYFLIKRRRA